MISYSQFINTVLYSPEIGYYMKHQEKVGTKGDFITSSNLSNVYGKLFANLFIQLIESGQIPPVICEIGGGNGRFAKAVLEEIENVSPNLLKDLTYIMIEKSPFHQHLQQYVVSKKVNVRQFDDIFQFYEYSQSYQGILFSNELFDAFPVEVIEKKGKSMYEVKITINADDELEERLVPLTNKDILMYLQEQEIELDEGQRFEVPLAMKGYVKSLGELIDKGVIFTVDYGYSNDEWMEPVHRHGSLRGYYQHQMINNPLLHPGDMDLTTHIHFDALINYGEEAGLHFVKKMRQDHFLLSAGILKYLQNHYDPNPFSEVSKQNRGIRTLISSEGMSSAFHVIIQQKNMEVNWETIFQAYFDKI